MPNYAFACTCGLQFNRILKMGANPTHPCPMCHIDAPRFWEGQGLAFDFKETAGAVPGNTGVHRDDYPTADRAIGRDAKQKWGYFHKRAEVKDQARALGGTHKLRRADGDGYTEYTTLTPAEAVVRKEKAYEVTKVMAQQAESRPK